MEQIALWFLFSVNTLLGVKSFDKVELHNWEVTRPWTAAGPAYVLEATSTEIVKMCHADPSKSILFPRIIHSAHKFYLDGKLIQSEGDPSFLTASPFYRQATVECSSLADGHILKWEAYSYSKYFARIEQAPVLTAKAHFVNFFNITANAIAAGILLILSIYSFLIFWRRVPDQVSLSVLIGGLSVSLYFFSAANLEFGLTFSMLAMHKLADIGLWIGAFFLFSILYHERIIPKSMLVVLLGVSVISPSLIFFGSTGDQVQFGTMLPMIPYFLSCCIGITNLVLTSIRSGLTTDKVIRFVSLSFFFCISANDLLSIMGFLYTPMVLSFGLAGYVFGISVAVNREIEKTYVERDELLENLERKVEEKTNHLSEALATLKSTQAELIHSSKLASLGTMSAGIAHEINNSINYVNGALRPLEKIIQKSTPEPDLGKATKLLGAIQQGTALTVEIVKSLRNYTGLNQAKYKDVLISEVISSILTILRSKLSKTKIDLEIEENITVFGSQVGLSQVLMNLISNAADAMPTEQPNLIIRSYSSGNLTILEVSDNGQGIPDEIKNKIFDPFFTTKEVGQGTGLGLHIVRTEVQRHGGSVEIQSAVNKGTTFKISLPKNSLIEQEEAA